MEKIELCQLKKMFQQGIVNVANSVEHLNNLNFFPVPDGDTGINLKQSLVTAWTTIKQLDTKQPIQTIGELVTKFSKEVLMNAQGNSGVIMSRVIRGLTNPLRTAEQSIPTSLLVEGFYQAHQLVYGAINQPTEGTMLTVLRYIKQQLTKVNPQTISLQQLLTLVYKAASKAVVDSPKLLPVLQANQTVDSGAYGLFLFFKGFLTALNFPTPEVDFGANWSPSPSSKPTTTEGKKYFGDNFGYCCEFVLNLNSKAAPNLTPKLPYKGSQIEKQLLKVGAESIVIVKEDNLVKLHCHLIQPYYLLKLGQKYGEFIKIKIDNMTEQHHHHINSLIAQIENLPFVPKINAVIYCYLPTTEVQEFVTNRFALQHFWNLETNGKPTYKDLAKVIYETKAKKIYGLITEPVQKKNFLYAEKFIPKKQELKTFHVQSLLGVLYILSQYQQHKKNWLTNKIINFYSAKINNIFIKHNNHQYLVYDHKHLLGHHDQLTPALTHLFDYCIYKNKRYLKTSDLVITTNDCVLKEEIEKFLATNRKKYVNQIFFFFVPSEKKLVEIGIIKCPKKSD